MPPAAAAAVAPTGAHAGLELVRRRLVPLVALLAVCLGLSCLLNVVQIAREVDDLSLVSGRFAGWAGAGACAGLCVALLALLAASRLGTAVLLAGGSTAAVFGLALGHSVHNEVGVASALVTLGVASGSLLGAAGCLPLAAPASRRQLTVVAWAVPTVAGVAVLDWLALGVTRRLDPLQVALHPPVWPLAVVSALLVSWSVLWLLLENRDSPPDHVGTGGARAADQAAQPSSFSRGAEDAWTALSVAAVVPLVAVMLLGFQPEVSTLWLRPLVLVIVAVAVLGLSFACVSMPSAAVRVGFAGVSVALMCWPADIGVLLLAASRSAEVSRVLLGLVVAAAAVGAGVGGRWPQRGVVGVLLVLAAGAGRAWAVPASHLLLVVPVAVMAGGTAAAVLGGLMFGLVSPLAARLVCAGALSALTLGVVLALPLSWSLGGGLPVTAPTAEADARVLLGLTFAAAVFGAGYAATGSRRRSLPAGGAD